MGKLKVLGKYLFKSSFRYSWKSWELWKLNISAVMWKRGKQGRGRAIFNICQAVIGFMIRTKRMFYSLDIFFKKTHFHVNCLNFEISLVPRCLSRCDHLLLSLSISVLCCTALCCAVHICTQNHNNRLLSVFLPGPGSGPGEFWSRKARTEREIILGSYSSYLIGRSLWLNCLNEMDRAR